MENSESQHKNIDEKKGSRDSPLVSIITPVLNGVTYLEECIQSVLNQSYPYIEHILRDGGSTDGTLEMLIGYQARYPDRISYLSEPGEDSGEAINQGWKMAKGDIFGWLGSDDIYEPDAIQTVVEFFKTNPEAYFVFGDCNIINEKGEIIGKRGTWDFNLNRLINVASMASPTSAFYKREVVEKTGPVDTKLRGFEFDYWIRVGTIFPIHRIDEVLSSFRRHKAGLNALKEVNRLNFREDLLVSRRYGGSILSPLARRYYRTLIFDSLRPVLGFTYPFIKKVLRLKG